MWESLQAISGDLSTSEMHMNAPWEDLIKEDGFDLIYISLSGGKNCAFSRQKYPHLLS